MQLERVLGSRRAGKLHDVKLWCCRIPGHRIKVCFCARRSRDALAKHVAGPSVVLMGRVSTTVDASLFSSHSGRSHRHRRVASFALPSRRAMQSTTKLTRLSNVVGVYLRWPRCPGGPGGVLLRSSDYGGRISFPSVAFLPAQRICVRLYRLSLVFLVRHCVAMFLR